MEFYSEPITVEFCTDPLLEKKPGLPKTFTWRGKTYKITKLLKEWHDYRKREEIQHFHNTKRGNTPETKLSRRGSWGVGRDYYRVLTDSNEIFDIYYDRKPLREKKGEWVLLKRVE